MLKLFLFEVALLFSNAFNLSSEDKYELTDSGESEKTSSIAELSPKP